VSLRQAKKTPRLIFVLGSCVILSSLTLTGSTSSKIRGGLFTRHPISLPAETTDSATTKTGVADWTKDFHGTMLADNEDWITIATFRDPTVNLPDSGIYEDEILQVSLDGSQRIRRICHTRCAIDLKTNTTSYWAMPKPTISRDGRFIAFTSNWEKSGRYDLFIAKVDPAPYLTATPAIAPAPVQRPRRARPSMTFR